MSTHTPSTPAPGGATPPAPHPNEELAVSGFHESDHLRTVTTAVEEDFLRMFGVVVDRDPAADHGVLATGTAHAVAEGVFRVIDKTRTAVDVHGLEEVLDTNLREALARINIDAHHNHLLAVNDTVHARRVRAICEAIRESLPAALLNDVIRYGLPAFVPENANLPEHIVTVECDINSPRFPGGPEVGPCRVEIDTRNYFWRQDHDKAHLAQNPTDLQSDLEAALIEKRQTFSALGIRIVSQNQPLPESFRLDTVDGPTDIANILNATAGGIDVSQRYENIDIVPPSLPGTRFSIDTSKIVRYRDNNGMLVAAMDRNQLLAELRRAGTDIWDYIMVQPQVTIWPPITEEEIADEIFAHFVAPPGGPLAIDNIPFIIIQREIAEQHRFFEQMREGSDNYWGAALATSLLMKHKDLRDAIVTRDAPTINADIATARQNLFLVELVTGIESLTAPAGGGTWVHQFAKRGDFARERTRLHAAPGTTHVITVGAGPTVETYTVGEDPNNRGHVNTDAGDSWIDAKQREHDQLMDAYKSMADKLNNVVTEVGARRGITTGLLIHNLVAHGGALNRRNFSSSMDIRAVGDDLRLHLGLVGKSRDDLAKELQKFQKELESGAEKPITGAEAQHRVISGELMRYHGLTEAEARSGTNVLRARSLLDTDMAQAAERFSNNLHEESDVPQGRVGGFVDRLKRLPEDLLRGDVTPALSMPWNWVGSRDRTMIQNIAHSCHVPQNAAHEPLWGQAQFYDDLIAAYHALDKLKKQKFYDRNSDVPFGVRLRERAGVDRAMNEISRALFQQHAKGVLQFYGPTVGLKEGDAERILADPQKLEYQRILQKILSSAPSPELAHKVKHAIEHAAKRTQPVQQMLSSTLFGKDWGAVTGTKNPLSIRGVLYGNKYASAVGAGKGIVEGTKYAWARKWGVAAGATLGFVALGPLAPVGILAGGILGGKFLFRPKSGGGSAH